MATEINREARIPKRRKLDPAVMSPQQRLWELENAVNVVDHERDALYHLDLAEQRKARDARAWRSSPNYFTNARISAVALLKMVTHARSGGSIEVMGLMTGQILENTFVVTDAYRLPVEGTETRVNAHEQAYEYMVQFRETEEKVGRNSMVVGWYHSHPGYGCWLSGIDVTTQRLHQTFEDPFLAVVIDPDRTISAGRVEIGAFRTYPEDYKSMNPSGDDDFQSIPLNKIEDFGAHSNEYYALDISHFKSSLDAKLLEELWRKFWVTTLSQSPLLTNRDFSSKQMQDLAKRIEDAARRGLGQGKNVHSTLKASQDAPDGTANQIVKASSKVAGAEKNGVTALEVKAQLFLGRQ